MLAGLASWLREWLLSGLQVCPQCGCLADRRHGSAACGRFLRDTIQEDERAEVRLILRVRSLEESRDSQAKLLGELSALTDDPFRE
jgi:hypothetical protein